MGAVKRAVPTRREIDGDEGLAERRARRRRSGRGAVWALGVALAAAPGLAAAQSGATARGDAPSAGTASSSDEAFLEAARGALQALRQFALVGRDRAQSREVEAFATRLAADVAADIFRLENHARRQGRGAAFGVIPDAPPPANLARAGTWAEALRDAPAERFDELFVAAAAKNLEAARRTTAALTPASPDRALGDIVRSFQRRLGVHAAEAGELQATVQPAPVAGETDQVPGASPGLPPASTGLGGAAPVSTSPGALAPPPAAERSVDVPGGEAARR